jgi:hypothetical protein
MEGGLLCTDLPLLLVSVCIGSFFDELKESCGKSMRPIGLLPIG